MKVGLINAGKQRGQGKPGKGRPRGKKCTCKGPEAGMHKASCLVWRGNGAGIRRERRERCLGLFIKGQSSRLRCLDKRPWGVGVGAWKASEPGKAMVKVVTGQVTIGPEGWPGSDKQETV